MITLSALTTILAWSTLINFGLLFISTIAMTFFKEPIAEIQSKLFDLDKTELRKLYYQAIAFYKILIIVFNLVPYLALRLM